MKGIQTGKTGGTSSRSSSKYIGETSTIPTCTSTVLPPEHHYSVVVYVDMKANLLSAEIYYVVRIQLRRWRANMRLLLLTSDSFQTWLPVHSLVGLGVPSDMNTVLPSLQCRKFKKIGVT